jgi:phosphoribosylaminoimidazolecarboxamide formyltransferase/IMP cyclohydrolase
MKRYALISVSNKEGLVEFARSLGDFGYKILSTGGTRRFLHESSIPAIDIAEYTGFPELFDGRLKTLHPKVHGGLLYKRDDSDHCTQAEIHGIERIDLLVVNLYPFAETISKEGSTYQSAIEQIDIGGPSMLRSAAKNHAAVTVIVDPNDYAKVLDELKMNNGETTPATRAALAAKVFAHTAAYDAKIAQYLSSQCCNKESSALPERLVIVAPQKHVLRYGENPHQDAALYGEFLRYFEQLHGKELSYNNLLDISAAVELIAEFSDTEPTLAILKHNNPCGVGSGSTLSEAWENAYATDRNAPFGGIFVTNCCMDGQTARLIAEIFSEVIIAPDFSPEALDILKAKKHLRLIVNKVSRLPRLAVRSIVGESFLVQKPDLSMQESGKVVTQRAPTSEEREALDFSWRVVKHVRSNAIVYAKKGRTLGIGAGQMSRVDASKIAVWKAKEAGLSLQGSVVASDAFFPFADGLIAAAEAGATAAIQPGGSVRDAEVIAAADRLGMAMVFTGYRHFRH